MVCGKVTPILAAKSRGTLGTQFPMVLGPFVSVAKRPEKRNLRVVYRQTKWNR